MNSVAAVLSPSMAAEPLLIVRRSLLSLMPRLAVLGSSLAALLLLVSLHEAGGEAGWLGETGLLGETWRWLLPVPIILTLELLRRYYNCSYVFEESTITGFLGHLSLLYRIPRVKYCDIVEIRVSQGPLGRLLGYGDVCVFTVARQCPTIRFSGVRQPLDLALFLDEMRDRVCSYTQAPKLQCTYRVRGKRCEKLPAKTQPAPGS